MKTYVLFGNDHSQSMSGLRTAALRDYNANSGAIKAAATREMQDTIVSTIAFGRGRGTVERDIVCSNPHVLKPMTSWDATGNTPLWDAVGDAIALMKSVPDYANPNVSFLLMFTTDGEEYGSRKENESSIAAKIKELNKEERWTIVFRVPKGARNTVSHLGLPAGNIQEWETTVAGMAASTAATTEAVDKFISARSAGVKSSTVFYANAAAVNTAALADITKDVSLYVVDPSDNGIQIRDFILKHRMEYLKGSAFYQLTKTEPKVSPSKIIAVRDRTTGKIYAGKEARQMLGLDTVNNIRLHPGDHGNFDLFIQSESVNRKLVGGTGVVYWKAIGKAFTDADLAYLQPKPVVPAVVALPAVPVTNKPTKSPIPVTKMSPAKPQPIVPSDGGRVRFYTAPAGAQFYSTRDMARAQATVQRKKSYDAGPTAPRGQRFYVA